MSKPNLETANIELADEFLANSAGNFVANEDSSLRDREWQSIDDAVIKISRENLNGIADLRTAGLVQGNKSIGTELTMYERSGDMTDADISMDLATLGQGDRLLFDKVGVPVPTIHKMFRIGQRQLAASRERGESLDTSQTDIATRKVAVSLENMLFNGVPDLIYANSRIYGYTTHPDRNTVSLTGGGWTSATATPYEDVIKMIKAANRDNMNGPFTIYVANDIWMSLFIDQSEVKGEKTHYTRILEVPGVSAIKPSASLADGNVIMVQMTSNVVDLWVAKDIGSYEWQEQGTYSDVNVNVLAIMVPRVKSEKNGQCGIVHAA